MGKYYGRGIKDIHKIRTRKQCLYKEGNNLTGLVKVRIIAINKNKSKKGLLQISKLYSITRDMRKIKRNKKGQRHWTQNPRRDFKVSSEIT